MKFKNEKKLLKIIKYTPSLMTVVFCIIIILMFFIEKNNSLEKEKQKIYQEHTKKNEELIKQKVDEVHSYIQREKELTTTELKKSLENEVENAYKIAYSIYMKNKDLDKNRVKKLIIEALREIRFNDGRGYLFIYDKQGINHLLPYNSELEGKNFINHKDSKGTLIIQDMIKLISTQNKAFYKWYWYNPKNPDVMREKIGLVKNFEPFDWFIGTGEYVEDFEKKIQERVLRNIKEIRFGNNGYIYIIDYDTIYLSHIRDEFIGKTALENNDIVGVKNAISDMIEIAKNGQGYYTYTQTTKPDVANTNFVTKISYVRGINDWNWLIGTGYYLDDMNIEVKKTEDELNENFRNYVIEIVKYSTILIIVLLLFSIYFSKLLQRRFEKYRKEISQYIDENSKQQNLLLYQSKMASMGEMIGNIAHQWRQPLSTITATASGIRLQNELNMLDKEFLDDGLKGISNSAMYLSHTIDDFRNFFKKDDEKTKFFVKDLIERTIGLISSKFNDNEINILKKIENIELDTHQNQLIQVIINLLNNAKDEFEKIDKSAKKCIFIDSYKKDDEYIIKIKDNAGGIPKEIIGKIFEQHFTTKSDVDGTGIGLFMSKEIIEKNIKGKISAYNEEFEYEGNIYKGAVFEIILTIC